jgi:hypothetical protein
MLASTRMQATFCRSFSLHAGQGVACSLACEANGLNMRNLHFGDEGTEKDAKTNGIESKVNSKDPPPQKKKKETLRLMQFVASHKTLFSSYYVHRHVFARRRVPCRKRSPSISTVSSSGVDPTGVAKMGANYRRPLYRSHAGSHRQNHNIMVASSRRSRDRLT